VRMAIALARRQAQIDKKLHLSVSLDSARMYLEREGALLRTMPVAIGAEGKVAAGSDSIPMPAPRGERTIAKFSSNEIVLDGGTLISAGALPAAGDTAAAGLRPGEVRISQSDMTAILPNISAGMKVYFY
ncbi:MAG: L,D-transpeptidase, partial [Gemmatimonadaceae bacterium]|nr:L,D-transpeptidase [Gemmatimonadaceae bacterium]